MVKRILGLSLLMVGLAGCGSGDGGGGGASAVADALNSTPAPTCACSIILPASGGEPDGGYKVFSATEKLVATPLCNNELSGHMYGCSNYKQLCTELLSDWAIDYATLAYVYCY